MFNALCATILALYLTQKHPLDNGDMGIVKRDKEVAKYLKIKPRKAKSVP